MSIKVAIIIVLALCAVIGVVIYYGRKPTPGGGTAAGTGDGQCAAPGLNPCADAWDPAVGTAQADCDANLKLITAGGVGPNSCQVTCAVPGAKPYWNAAANRGECSTCGDVPCKTDADCVAGPLVGTCTAGQCTGCAPPRLTPAAMDAWNLQVTGANFYDFGYATVQCPVGGAAQPAAAGWYDIQNLGTKSDWCGNVLQPNPLHYTGGAPVFTCNLSGKPLAGWQFVNYQPASPTDPSAAADIAPYGVPALPSDPLAPGDPCYVPQ